MTYLNLPPRQPPRPPRRLPLTDASVARCSSSSLPISFIPSRHAIASLPSLHHHRFTTIASQATDTIAKTAELANQKYGVDPAYREYVASTPLVLPSYLSLKANFTEDKPLL